MCVVSIVLSHPLLWSLIKLSFDLRVFYANRVIYHNYYKLERKNLFLCVDLFLLFISAIEISDFLKTQRLKKALRGVNAFNANAL